MNLMLLGRYPPAQFLALSIASPPSSIHLPSFSAQSRSPQMKPEIPPPKSPVPHSRSILIWDTLSCFSPTAALPADKSESLILPVSQSQCSYLKLHWSLNPIRKWTERHELIIYWWWIAMEKDIEHLKLSWKFKLKTQRKLKDTYQNGLKKIWTTPNAGKAMDRYSESLLHC